MRRRGRDLDAIPVELRDFDPGDWPGDVADAFTFWRSARGAWADRHGGWPGGPLAQLSAESDVRAVLNRSRLLPWSRSDAELAVVLDRLEHLYGYRPKLLPRRADHDAPSRRPIPDQGEPR